MFGRPSTWPQTEETPLLPRNPYGISKVAAYHLIRAYRDLHGMFCCTGFLPLRIHESPRRRAEFVTRKITSAAARIKAGRQQFVELGNLQAKRDWGYAPDYVRAMHAMLNHTQAEDFVVATGTLHTVQNLCEAAFGHVGLNWQDHVKVNPLFVRTENEVHLVGDPTKIQTKLGWNSTQSFDGMIREMVNTDLSRLAEKRFLNCCCNPFSNNELTSLVHLP